MNAQVIEYLGWGLAVVWFVLGFAVSFILDLSIGEAAIVYVYSMIGIAAASLVFYATGLDHGTS